MSCLTGMGKGKSRSCFWSCYFCCCCCRRCCWCCCCCCTANDNSCKLLNLLDFFRRRPSGFLALLNETLRNFLTLTASRLWLKNCQLLLCCRLFYLRYATISCSCLDWLLSRWEKKSFVAFPQRCFTLFSFLFSSPVRLSTERLGLVWFCVFLRICYLNSCHLKKKPKKNSATICF